MHVYVGRADYYSGYLPVMFGLLLAVGVAAECRGWRNCRFGRYGVGDIERGRITGDGG